MWWTFLPQSVAPWLLAVVAAAEAQLQASFPAPPAWDAAAPPQPAPAWSDWWNDAAAVARCEAQLPVVRAVCLESLAEALAGRDEPRDIVWLLYLWDRHGAAPRAAVYRVIAADPTAAEPRLALGRMLGTSFALRALASDLLELGSPGAGTAAGAAWQQLRPKHGLQPSRPQPPPSGVR